MPTDDPNSSNPSEPTSESPSDSVPPTPEPELQIPDKPQLQPPTAQFREERSIGIKERPRDLPPPEDREQSED